MTHRTPRTGHVLRRVLLPFVALPLFALPLFALALAPGAGRAAAHPSTLATSAISAAPAIGKADNPEMDLTLHLHDIVSVEPQPTFVAADAQGNTYYSSASLDQVLMHDPSDNYVQSFGSGTTGTGSGNLAEPEGIAVSGNDVYVGDYGNHMIQVFNKTTGNWISQFGTADLSSPRGLAIGTNGTLYVVDFAANRIAEFTTGGTYLGSFGSAGASTGQFSDPYGIAASPFGTLYVTDNGNQRVQEFDLAGNYVTQWGHASFNSPAGIAVDRAGMVYVVDQLALVVYKFDAGGSEVGYYSAPKATPAIPGTFSQPLGIAVTSVPNTPIAVYVTDFSNGVLLRFDQVINPQNHTYQAQWGSSGTSNGQFNSPWGTVVDTAGNVYVTDSSNNRVEKFDQFGNFLTAFGTSGSGQLSGPAGIAISPDGSTLYVADTYNNRIVEFNTSGAYVGQFGTYGNGNGQLYFPEAMATDGSFIYVADTYNSRIEVFDTSGTYQFQFGSQGTADNQFYLPEGIAVDINRGELFISDYENNRVEVYDTFGQLVTTILNAGGVAHPVGIATDQRGDVYVADSLDSRIVEFDVNLTVAATFGSAGSGNGQFVYPYAVAVSPASGQLYVVDASNNRIERWGSPWPKYDTIGIYRPSTKTFYLRNENLTGPADISVYMPYAQTGDLPIVGDWNGDGVDAVGLYRPSKARFLLQDSNRQESAPDYVFTLGIAGDTPIVGDWNGDGSDGAGIFRPSNGILYLKNTLSTGVADDTLVLGIPGDVGIAGDWNGDGQDSPGVYRPTNERFYVTNKVTNGVVTSDHSAVLGISGDAPFTGDWVAQGFSGIGVFRPTNGVTYEKNAISTGPADNNFIYGVAGDIPVAGQWVSPSVPFSKPAPHTSLGTRSSGAASHSPSGGASQPAPAHTPSSAPAATLAPRRNLPRAD